MKTTAQDRRRPGSTGPFSLLGGGEVTPHFKSQFLPSA